MSRYYIYDSFTDTVAEFAKKKDNRRRNAMIGAGSVAGLGAIGAGVRYGGAALKTRSSLERLRKARAMPGADISSLGDEMAGGGARGQLARDAKYLRGRAGSVGRAVKLRGGQALGLATSKYGLAALGAGALAGGAYLGAKAMNKRKRDRNSIRGRVRALLGR